MSLANRIRDLIAETTSQRALDRSIREAVTTDPDAAEIFQTAKHPPQRIARSIDNPRHRQRAVEIQRYAETKSAKGQMRLFYALFD